MTKPVTHFSRIFRLKDRTVTSTLCGRMTQAEINCSTVEAEVTCKFCLKQLSYRRAA